MIVITTLLGIFAFLVFVTFYDRDQDNKAIKRIRSRINADVESRNVQLLVEPAPAPQAPEVFHAFSPVTLEAPKAKSRKRKAK